MPLDNPAAFRVPPHNFEAEMAVLAALVQSGQRVADIQDRLRPEMFADAAHRSIYDAMLALTADGVAVDPVTLTARLDGHEELARLGGAPAYVANLAAAPIVPKNAADYAGVVRAAWRRREAVLLAEAISGTAGEDKAIALAAARLAELADPADKAAGPRPIRDVLDDAIAAAEEAYKHGVVGVKTGFQDLDGALGAFRRDQLIVLGARPGMGKTTVAANIVRAAATQGPVAWFSLEMSGRECVNMLIAQLSGVPAFALQQGKIRAHQWDAIMDARAKLAALPIYIDDQGELAVATIRARAARLNPALIVVDHLGLSSGAVPGAEYRSLYERVSAVSAALKGMAKGLHVPVLALAQLSRGVEGRDEKRPHLADLRESGSIEQDADVVMFLFRAEYYLRRIKDAAATSEALAKAEAALAACAGMAELSIAKQRMGPLATVKLRYDAARSLYLDDAADAPRQEELL